LVWGLGRATPLTGGRPSFKRCHKKKRNVHGQSRGTFVLYHEGHRERKKWEAQIAGVSKGNGGELLANCP